ELIIKALVAARQRNVRIRILMPGENTDSDMARMASKESWGPLLMAGVEMYEYEPTMFHNKMLIVDKELVSVGSTNFDLRSFQLNDEASLNVYDRDFAERMTQVFEQDLGKAKGYTYETWKKRPWTEKLVEKIILPLRSQL
ncbi:MAG: phospholipase D-like domain-containing protein, partial [Luteimonas sp.]